MAAPSPAPRRRRVAQLEASLLVAVVLTIGLQVSMAPARLVVPYPGVAIVGILLMWCVLLLVWALVGRLHVAAWAVSLVCLVLGVANTVKLHFLGSPVAPPDAVFLRDPGQVVGMVGPGRFTGLVAVVALVGALGWLLASRAGRSGRVGHSGSVALRRGERAALAGVGALALVAMATFQADSSPLRRVVEAVGGDAESGWVLFSYNRNGVLVGSLYSLPDDAMERPVGYDDEALHAAADRILAVSRAEDVPAQGADAAPTKPNVVVVLNESFADPTTIPGVTLDEDPLASWRRDAAESTSGSTMGLYGTGTSMMEFQVLTGMSAAFIDPTLISPYQEVVAGRSTFPSIVSWLEERGYDTTAIHPFSGTFYSRDRAYDALGFDEFVTAEGFDGPQLFGAEDLVSDAQTYDRVLDELEEADGPALVHVVTIKNHMPHYPSGDPVEVTGSLDPAVEEGLGEWSRGLANSSRAWSEFLDEVEELDEPTVVLGFGDHFPPVLDEGTREGMGAEGYTTPWIIRTIGFDDAAGDAPPRADGVVAASALLGRALEQAGMEVPPMHRSALEIQSEVGALTQHGWFDRSGEEIDAGTLTPAQEQLVEDHRLVQYDQLVGEESMRDSLW